MDDGDRSEHNAGGTTERDTDLPRFGALVVR